MKSLTAHLLWTLLTLSAPFGATAQGYDNPVLPGMYPDPSICRAGEDYYMVNSSFQFFPGVPVHHSRDLIHWEQIGHCLTRRSQLDLSGANYWLGIYAPTIRYHEGTFYMITTNVPKGGNFYVSTQDPAGEWSEPIFVEMAGIDPDLFFEEDRCYYLSTIDGAIRMCEIDIRTGRKLTELRPIWEGTGGRHPEAPHLYKKDGWYYLLIAEGGTEYGHGSTIARSRSPYGPYRANPSNPILTHRGSNASANPIQGVGHADLVCAHDGSWWLVALGFRPQSYMHHLLGRETFLAPVRWDRDAWPVVNGDGTIRLRMECPTLPQQQPARQPVRDEFDGAQLAHSWCHLCNPHPQNYSLTERKGFVRLHATPVGIRRWDASPTMICRRQQHIDFRATAALDYAGMQPGAEAGMTIYMAPNYQYILSVREHEQGAVLTLAYLLGDIAHTACEIPIQSKGKRAYLRVEGSADRYAFLYSTDGRTYTPLDTANTRFLSSETTGGFTGVVLGLFAESDTEGNSYADFDWFEYSPVGE